MGGDRVNRFPCCAEEPLHFGEADSRDLLSDRGVLQLPEPEIRKAARDLEVTDDVLDRNAAERILPNVGECLLHELAGGREFGGRFAADNRLDADEKGCGVAGLRGCGVAGLRGCISRESVSAAR